MKVIKSHGESFVKELADVLVSDLHMMVGGRGRHGRQRSGPPAGQVAAVGGVGRLRILLDSLKRIKKNQCKHERVCDRQKL